MFAGRSPWLVFFSGFAEPLAGLGSLKRRPPSAWSFPPVAELVSDFDLRYVDMDQCMCGAPAQKTTRLMTNPSGIPALRARFARACCDGGHTHSTVVGDPEDGVFKSAAAEAYSRALAAGPRFISDRRTLYANRSSAAARWL